MADVYMDGSIVSASGTGTGTASDPYGKTDDLLQYALDNTTQGATGDRFINLAGSIVATTPIDFTTYGTPSMDKPFDFNGGTQRTEYDMGGVRLFDSTSQNVIKYSTIQSFDFINPPVADRALFLGYGMLFINNTFTGSSSSSQQVLKDSYYCELIGNRFTNINGNSLTGGPVFDFAGRDYAGYNYLEFDGGFGQYGIYPRGVFEFNIIICKNMTSGLAAVAFLDNCIIKNNTLYGDGNLRGFQLASSTESVLIENNYIENFNEGFFSSTGSTAHIIAGNRAFNNGSNPLNTLVYGIEENNNYSMSQSGLVNPSGGNYKPNENLISQGFSRSRFAIDANGFTPTIGAINGNIMPPRVRDIY